MLYYPRPRAIFLWFWYLRNWNAKIQFKLNAKNVGICFCMNKWNYTDISDYIFMTSCMVSLTIFSRQLRMAWNCEHSLFTSLVTLPYIKMLKIAKSEIKSLKEVVCNLRASLVIIIYPKRTKRGTKNINKLYIR